MCAFPECLGFLICDMQQCCRKRAASRLEMETKNRLPGVGSLHVRGFDTAFAAPGTLLDARPEIPPFVPPVALAVRTTSELQSPISDTIAEL